MVPFLLIVGALLLVFPNWSIVILGGTGVLYYVSLRTHPYRRCRFCHGRKGLRHPVLGVRGNAYRPCPVCRGSGQTMRLGARSVRMR